jgi:cephalosporin-C deacetylase-like acetyl esterase
MARQAAVKDKLMEMVGPFPEKTPLKPRITGTIKGDGYRIEKIIFEAMPGYYVTGCIYVPEGIKGKVPAILNVIGHNQEAFRNPLYQVINYNLVKRGMIVFAIDPPGQGEHVQYYDPQLKSSSVGYTVVEHCYFGNQTFISGSSAARYFIWEGIRAIDYLVSRKEVDPERIGVTGFSGGGTVTTYLSAFDDRVKVSIPCSWATSNRRQLETKGVQDAENSFIHGLANGITLEDLLEVRAPKPTLLTFTTRDQYLTIQGAREAYAEAKKTYLAHGAGR